MKTFAIGLAAAVVMGIGGVGGARTVPDEQDHVSSLSGTLILINGESRNIVLEGVGCTSSLCSRVLLNTRKADEPGFTRVWLDSISAIRDVTKDDALFLFRDGTERRLSVFPLNRVLYIKGRWLGREKIGLETVRSLEFERR